MFNVATYMCEKESGKCAYFSLLWSLLRRKCVFYQVGTESYIFSAVNLYMFRAFLYPQNLILLTCHSDGLP
jgi:hypothetical protein